MIVNVSLTCERTVEYSITNFDRLNGVLHFKLKCNTPLKSGGLQGIKGDEGMQWPDLK